MSDTLRLLHRMTVDEFQGWIPPEGLEDRRWELVDGEPVCMAPPSENHGAIQYETARLIGNHLAASRPDCRGIVTPGVIPRARSDSNERVPDLAVTCSPPMGARTVQEPMLLIEILSPSNEAKTRANVWAYVTIPSVREVLLLSSTSIKAELLRRDPDGNWPPAPVVIDANSVLQLASIGFTVPLSALYATSSLRRDGG